MSSSNSPSSPPTVADPDNLQFPYVPLDRRVWAEDRVHAFNALPLERLPKSLLFSTKAELRPPKLHYGWLIDDSWRSKHRASIDKILKDAGVRKQDTDRLPFLNMVRSLLGEKHPPHINLVLVFDPVTKKYQKFASIFTNYSIKRGIYTPKQRRALREYFGDSESGKWYISALYWHWTRNDDPCSRGRKDRLRWRAGF